MNIWSKTVDALEAGQLEKYLNLDEFIKDYGKKGTYPPGLKKE